MRREPHPYLHGEPVVVIAVLRPAAASLAVAGLAASHWADQVYLP
jgi:hypothetical protein